MLDYIKTVAVDVGYLFRNEDCPGRSDCSFGYTDLPIRGLLPLL